MLYHKIHTKEDLSHDGFEKLKKRIFKQERISFKVHSQL